jgi:hypothetical protein
MDLTFQNITQLSGDVGGALVNPPAVLLSFVPLAVLCNKVMEALRGVI